jgi:glycosyltransferase 2 family protein
LINELKKINYKIAFLLLKFLALILTLTYLISTKKITLASVDFITSRTGLFISIIVIILFISIPLVSLRWAIILKNLESKKKGLIELYKITLIAQFFAIFIPGSATADLSKGYYLHKDNKNKTNIYFSILLDRIIGFYSIIFLIFISYTYNYRLISSFEYISIFCNFLLISFIIFNLIIFLFKRKLLKILQSIELKFIGQKIQKIIACIELIQKTTLIKGFLLSILNQVALIVIFLTINIPFNNLGIHDFLKITFITPIGEIASMIPLFPVGIGIGHISFEELYLLFGYTNGANIFNIFIVAKIIVGVIGGLTYIFYSRKS